MSAIFGAVDGLANVIRQTEPLFDLNRPI